MKWKRFMFLCLSNLSCGLCFYVFQVYLAVCVFMSFKLSCGLCFYVFQVILRCIFWMYHYFLTFKKYYTQLSELHTLATTFLLSLKSTYTQLTKLLTLGTSFFLFLKNTYTQITKLLTLDVSNLSYN